MKRITVVYGQQHKGNTWEFTQLFLKRFPDSEITEYYLPESSSSYCIGCINCMLKGEHFCPHAKEVQPLVNSLDEAELIIMVSPCYVLGMTGQLKTLLDHMGYRHMAHRPEPSMFSKQALVLSTAAGMGAGKTVKAISENLFYWGVAKTYHYGIRIAAADFNHIPVKRRKKIEQKVNTIVNKIKKNEHHVRTGIKTKLIFAVMRLGQKQNEWNPTDKEYWKKNGWL